MDLEDIEINAGNWDDSAKDRDYWRALVNGALDLRVPQVMELELLKLCPGWRKSFLVISL